MKSVKKKILDIAGRSLKDNDQVFILDIPCVKTDMSKILNSLSMGKIVHTQDENNILVKIGNEIFLWPAQKLSKISTDENIDDIIVRVSHDIESIQLQNESEILNKMLNIDEK